MTRRAITAACLALAALAAGCGHDPKLTFGNAAVAGDGHWRDPKPPDELRLLYLPYHEGREARFAVSVRNEDDRPVTLQAVRLQTLRFSLFQQTGATATLTEGTVPADDRSLRPVRGLTLAPGKQAYLVVTVRLGGCRDYMAGSEVRTNRLEIDTTDKKAIEITFPFDVAVRSPRQCPGRKP
jgi:hypothetical protein